MSGPTSAPYHAVVRLTGTTPDPNSTATIYFRDDATSAWKAGRTATSDASRRWSTTFTLTHDKYYYASANGHRSTIDSTRLVRATCRTSASLFHNPMLDREPKSPSGEGIHAALTATRNGLWAGYVFRDYPMEFDAITWRHGQKRPTVLARFPLRGSGNYLPYGHGSLDIAGVSPTGTVVAAVQTRLTGGHINYRGYAWRKGRTYHLSASPRWTSVHPVGVTASGAIIGNVATRGGIAVVRWANAASRFHVLLPASRHGHDLVSVTDRGDVVYDYSTDGGSKIYVLTASGRRVALVGPNVFDDAGIPFITGGNRVYGAAGPGGIAYWNLEAAPPSGDMSPSGILVSRGADLEADSAGRRGGLFMTDDRYSHRTRMFYRTQRGAMVRLAPSKNAAGTAIDTAGNLAVTSTKHGDVHFVRCH